MVTGGLGETWSKLHVPCVQQSDAAVYQCRGLSAGKEVVATTRVEVVGQATRAGCPARDRLEAAPIITGWLSTIMVQAGDTARLVCDLEVILFLFFNDFLFICYLNTEQRCKEKCGVEGRCWEAPQVRWTIPAKRNKSSYTEDQLG